MAERTKRAPRSGTLQESIDRFQAQGQQQTADRAVQQERDELQGKDDPLASRTDAANAKGQARRS